MKAFVLFLLTMVSLWSVELPDGIEEEQAEEIVLTIQQTDIKSEVSILCYHDFTTDLEATEMRIKASLFRDQMTALKKSGINVISLTDFLAWKSGQLQLPAQNVMITIDDGWRAVYEVAFPILKEYEFPFVLGLYTNFIGNGGRSLDKNMVKAMLQSGMEIASHSVSHPFPSTVKKERAKGQENYEEYLKKELGSSKISLEEDFKRKVISYIYPGGYFTKEMYPSLRASGYLAAFTVRPGKVTLETPAFEIPRYVVLGTSERLFQEAIKFSDAPSLVEIKLPYPVKPLPQRATSQRRPWIGIDLSSVDDLDPESVVMYVGSFGKVKGAFLPGTQKFEWQATRPLRRPSYPVYVQWKRKGESRYDKAIQWEFFIDHHQEYLNISKPK